MSEVGSQLDRVRVLVVSVPVSLRVEMMAKRGTVEFDLGVALHSGHAGAYGSHGRPEVGPVSRHVKTDRCRQVHPLPVQLELPCGN